MSILKCKILGTDTITSKKDGKQHHFLRVEAIISTSIYLPNSAVPIMGVYDKCVGQIVGLNTSIELRNGNVSLSIDGDPSPLLFASVDVATGELAHTNPVPETPASTEKPRNPLFGAAK